MHGKKYLAIFTVSFIIIYGLAKIPPLSRAASEDDQIPSDLSLDLDLAQKDPAPEQKQIVQFQTSQAKIVTDKGEQAVVVVKDELPPEVKLQSAKDALNPEQTTSEQVVNKNVESNQDQSVPAASGSPSDSNGNNPTPTPSGNVIPGTDILEPDDNTAPLPSSSATTQPNSNQDQTKSEVVPVGSDAGNSAQPAVSAQPETPQPVNTINTIPPENGVAPASAAPQQEQSQPSSNSESAPSEPSGSNNSGSNSSSGSESSGGDSSAVQGVSTGSNISWWQQLLNRLTGIWK